MALLRLFSLLFQSGNGKILDTPRIDRLECVFVRRSSNLERKLSSPLLFTARRSSLSQVSCFLFAFHLSHCARASASGWTHVARQNAIGTRNERVLCLFLLVSLSLSFALARDEERNRKRPRVDRRRLDKTDTTRQKKKKRKKKKRERQPAEFSSWRMKVAFRGTRANRRRQIFDFHRGREGATCRIPTSSERRIVEQEERIRRVRRESSFPMEFTFASLYTTPCLLFVCHSFSLCLS